MRPYLADGSILAGAEKIVILNSVTVSVGDPVKLSTSGGVGGVDAADAATDRVYGVCVGISSDKGIPLSKLVSGTDYDGTYTESLSGDTYVSASDNVTDKKIQALVVPIEYLILEADLSDGAGASGQARGTTAGSDQIGYYLDVDTTDSRYLDETSSSTSTSQYIIVKNHPSDTTKTLVKCVERQVAN